LIIATVPLLLEVLLVFALSTLLTDAENQRAHELLFQRSTSIGARLFAQMSLAPYFLVLGIFTKAERFFERFDIEFAKVQVIKKEMDDFGEANKSKDPLLDNTQADKLLEPMFRVFEDMRKGADDPTVREGTAALPRMRETSFCEVQTTIRRNLASGFIRNEDLLSETQNRLETNRNLQYGVVFGGGLISIFASIALWNFFRNSILERIRTIEKNTEALSQKGWLIPEMGGDDEISKLDRAFHQMHKTLLKAAEIEKALFNNASDIIFVLNSDEKFLQINPAGERGWGYPVERLQVSPIYSILLEEEIDRVRDQIDLAKSTEAPQAFEAAIRTREGKLQYGLWSIFWSSESQNLYCIFHDITQNRLIKQERNAYLSMISSDLQVPLLRIAQSLKALVSGENSQGLSATALDKTTIAERNLKRLLVLVKELIQVTEMESGTLEIHPSLVKVSQLLQAAASDVQQLALTKSIELIIEPSALSVYADEDKIMQVLVNLLSNAIKFSPDKSSVELSAEKEKSLVRFRITDHGRGIPANQKHLVFEKFKQVEAADAKRKAGTGLGLPICKDLVEKHGGIVGVESEAGKGSTFWFTLPNKAPSAGAALSTGDFEDNANSSNAIAKGKKIDKRAGERGAPQDTEHSQQNAAKWQKRAVSPAASKADKSEKAYKPDQHSLANGGRDALARGARMDTSRLRQRAQESSEETGAPRRKIGLTLAMQGLILIGLPLTCELVFAGNLSMSLLKVQAQRSEELKMRRIGIAASKGLRSLVDLSGQMLCEDHSLGIDFASFEKRWNISYAELITAIANDPKFSAQEDKLAKQYEKGLTSFSSDQTTNVANKLDMTTTMLGLTIGLNKIIQTAEDNEYVDPEVEKKAQAEQRVALTQAIEANAVLSLILTIFFAFGISRRLVIMATNTQRLANDESLNPPVGGGDEIADLDAAFHRASKLVAEIRKKERAVFDNCKDVLCVISKEGKFVSLNPAAEIAWAVDRTDVEKIALNSLIAGADRVNLDAVIMGVPDKPIEAAVELQLTTPNQKQLWTLWSINRGKGQRNSFCVVRDITDRKQLEQLRQDFLAVVSHDLRTPLTGVLGVASLIAAGAFGQISPNVSYLVKGIVRNCHSLLELINDILDLEKLEANQMTLNPSEVGLKELTESLAASCQSAGVPLRISVTGENLHGKFLCDGDRYLQALMNLVKYLHYRIPEELGDSGAPRSNNAPISVQFRKLGPGIETFIFDASAEIREEVRESIFQRLKDASLKEGVSEPSFHAELALPLAQKIIATHGGTIDLKSKPDSNCFIVRLPFQTPA